VQLSKAARKRWIHRLQGAEPGFSSALPEMREQHVQIKPRVLGLLSAISIISFMCYEGQSVCHI
jgi:hypothetical protein